MNDEAFTLEAWLDQESEVERQINGELPDESESIQQGLRLFALLLKSMMDGVVATSPDAAKCILIARLYTDLLAAWLLLRRGYWTQFLAILRHGDEATAHLRLFTARPDEVEKWLSGKRFEIRDIWRKMPGDHASTDVESTRYSDFSRIVHPNVHWFYMQLNEIEANRRKLQRPADPGTGITKVPVIGRPDHELLRPSLVLTMTAILTALESSTDAIKQWLTPSQDWNARFQAWREKCIWFANDVIEEDKKRGGV